MLKYHKPKGTHDQYPGASDWADDSARRAFLEATFRDICRLYGYGEIRTPLFETTDLFKRAVGEGTDIVSKEMYTFTSKGDDSLTLRPESTAPVLRAYLENGIYAQGGVSKLFYVAAHFRYERPQKGRYRQHEQLGLEALGTDDPALDAEIIQLALAFYRRIGIQNLTLKLNSVGSTASREAYMVALKKYVEPYLSDFGQDGQTRFVNNPLRMLDTKNPRELEILATAPQLKDFLLDDERSHFETLCGYLSDTNTQFEIDPYLVRGFDYYTKTAFEIQSPDLGAQNALGGGGRYNKLVEDLGGPPTPGIGFGLGLERALVALQALNIEMPPANAPLAYVVVQGETARPVSIRLLARLRAANIAADMDYGARSLKAQMRAAARSHARYALVLGDDEVAQGSVQFKDLNDGTQQTLMLDDAVSYLETVLTNML